jgi:adenosylcobyric acid synthase
VDGYEIHHGVAQLTGPGAEPFPGGCRGGRAGAVWGTSWHGVLENDEFRQAFLTEVAALAGRDFTPAPGTDFAQLREARLDALGDLVAGHLDTAALTALISGGPPRGLPVIPPAGVPAPAGRARSLRCDSDPGPSGALRSAGEAR